MHVDAAHRSSWDWRRERVRAHWHWGTTQGWGRLVEEDQLDPVDRLRLVTRKARWRHLHGLQAGVGVPLLVVGLQRSGTNMLVRGLERAPEVEVHNENDRRVFTRFRVQDEALASVTAASRHAVVLFKPLCDSHRTVELLGATGSPSARAVWIYRSVDGRVRPSVAKFGGHNLEVLGALADGSAHGTWQAGGLDEEAVDLVRRLDPARLDAAGASAVFWYLRNSLYFRQGLHRRPDVHLSSYDAFVAEPALTMEPLCELVGLPFRPEFVAHVDGRATGVRPLRLPTRVRELCDELTERLDRTRRGGPA
jgi:hypothetical protein